MLQADYSILKDAIVMTAQLKRIIDDWFLLEPVLFAAFLPTKW